MADFPTPRVFEYVGACSGLTYRIELRSDDKPEYATRSDGMSGVSWSLPQVIDDMNSNRKNPWREITEPTPPFDPSKLDCAGVFHVAPEPILRWYYAAGNPQMIISHPSGPVDGWIEFPRPDIANETIADLRRELKAAQDTLELVRRLRVHELEALRVQLQSAWKRLDYATADRIADLIGDQRPSDHKATDLQPGESK